MLATIFGEANVVSDPVAREATVRGEKITIASARCVCSGGKRDKDDAFWFSIQAFGGWVGDRIQQLRKGDKVAFCGRLECNNYESKDGTKKVENRVTVSSLSKIERWGDVPATVKDAPVESAPKQPDDDEPPF